VDGFSQNMFDGSTAVFIYPLVEARGKSHGEKPSQLPGGSFRLGHVSEDFGGADSPGLYFAEKTWAFHIC